MVIITYYYKFFESFPLGRMSFYQLLTTYYRYLSVAVSIKEFHLVKDIKLIVIITYYSELFEGFPLGRMSFHQPLTSCKKYIDVAVILKRFYLVKNIKGEVMLAPVGEVNYICSYWFHNCPYRLKISTQYS